MRVRRQAVVPQPLSPQVLLDRIVVEESRRACEESLYTFVQEAWHIIEPGVEFVNGEHIQQICRHLEAITRGDIRFLLINIPPRHAKSTIVCVMWPCWEWTQQPQNKYLCASYSSLLSTRDNLKSRRLMQSAWYQARWGKAFRFTSDQNQKMRFENDHTGYRIASSVGGTATGEGGNRLILDDPHAAMEAQSDAVRESDIEWFDQTWSTRMNDPKKDASVVIMQRLHMGDVSGRILEMGGWEHLCFPFEYDGIRRKTVLGYYDTRTKKNQLLWPARFGPTELHRLKRSLGEYGTAGQLQQLPAPAEGGILKPDFIRLWPSDEPLPQLTYVLQSYDTAHTNKKQNDPSAQSTWGVFFYKKEYHVLLLDAWSEFYTFPKLRTKAIREWRSEYGGDRSDPANPSRRPDLVLVEAKASGYSLLQDLVLAKVACAKFDPGDLDKVARAHIVAPVLSAGYVWVPESGKHPGEWATWAEDFKKQLQAFPNAEHDDYVDTFTQALIHLKSHGFIKIKDALPPEEDPLIQDKRKPGSNYYYA